MALDSAIYFVTKDIAIRSGVIQSRYRIADGRFVLDNKDLSRVRFTTDEYINGLEGVEKTDYQTAQTMIAANGYQMGLEEEPVVQENQPQVEETETEVENDNNNGDETENDEQNGDTTEEEINIDNVVVDNDDSDEAVLNDLNNESESDDNTNENKNDENNEETEE